MYAYRMRQGAGRAKPVEFPGMFVATSQRQVAAIFGLLFSRTARAPEQLSREFVRQRGGVMGEARY